MSFQTMFPAEPPGGPDAEHRRPHADVADLIVLKRRLDHCETAAELLAVASSVGPGLCGFERGLVLSVVDGHLSSNGMDALDDPASDALRHRCQLEPVALAPHSEEAEVIHVAQGGRPERESAPSVLAEALGLQKYALAPVVPESQVLALAVFDRPNPVVKEHERAAAQFFACLLGLQIIRVVLRSRLREVGREVRYLTSTANSLLREAQVAPIGPVIDMNGPAR